MLELLLERSKLCKGRIGIRLFVAPPGTTAERLGVILLAFSAIDTVTAFATWPVAPPIAVLPFGAFALALHLLLTFVPILTLLAIRPITMVVTRAAWRAGGLSGVRGGGGRRRRFFVGCWSTCFDGRRRRNDLGLRPVWPP